MSDPVGVLNAMFAEARRHAQALRDAEAEQIYRAILRIIPHDPVPAYNLATTLLRQGKYEEGFRFFEARAYLGDPGVVKPAYRRDPLPLPPEAKAWGEQTLDAAALSPFLRVSAT